MHKCEYDFPQEGHGPAVDCTVEKEDGTLWVANGEYSSQVNFCPACGYEAKVKVVINLPTKDLDCDCSCNEGCGNCDGCEQGFGCEYPVEGC